MNELRQKLKDAGGWSTSKDFEPLLGICAQELRFNGQTYIVDDDHPRQQFSFRVPKIPPEGVKIRTIQMQLLACKDLVAAWIMGIPTYGPTLVAGSPEYNETKRLMKLYMEEEALITIPEFKVMEFKCALLPTNQPRS